MTADDEKFRVVWSCDDGYVGGRPQSFSITADSFFGDETDDALKALFWEEVEHDFRENVRAVSSMETEFVEWARKVIAERNAEEER